MIWIVQDFMKHKISKVFVMLYNNRR